MTSLRPSRVSGLLLVALIVLAAGCTLYNLEKELPPPYAEFLSQARYLITTEERRAFLATADSGKDAFIEDFWKRRDPDPETPENEVKTEYYTRISRANELFMSEGIQGWLTDRGRVYVIYGPPTERRTQPMGDSTRRCQEAWFYGNYVLLFEDPSCTGAYRLMTFDLGPLQGQGLDVYGRSGAGGRMPGAVSGGAKPLFDFSASVRLTSPSSGRVAGSVRIEIPFRRIWFKAEAGRLATTFDVTVEVRDADQSPVWQTTASSVLSVSQNELEEKLGSSHVIEVPVTIEEASVLARLGRGKDSVSVTLTNRTGSEVLKKSFDWE